MSVTGNPVRDEMIRAAVRQAQEDGKPVTVAVLGLEHLPGDFDLSQDELDGVLATMVAPQEAPAVADPLSAEPDAPAEAESAESEPALTMDEARDRLVRLQDALAEARGAVLTLAQRQRDARAKLSDAIVRFQTGFAKVTPTELLRQHVREQAELRAQGKNVRARVGQPGPSVVDQMAYYSRGGTVNRGNGPRWRRGAFAVDSYGAPNTDPRRGAIAKLPSQR